MPREQPWILHVATALEGCAEPGTRLLLIVVVVADCCFPPREPCRSVLFVAATGKRLEEGCADDGTDCFCFGCALADEEGEVERTAGNACPLAAGVCCRFSGAELRTVAVLRTEGALKKSEIGINATGINLITSSTTIKAATYSENEMPTTSKMPMPQSQIRSAVFELHCQTRLSSLEERFNKKREGSTEIHGANTWNQEYRVGSP